MDAPTELEALYALLVAAAVTTLLTPLTMLFARRVGAIDEPRERGLSIATDAAARRPGDLRRRARRGADLAAGRLPASSPRTVWQGVLYGCAH